MYYLGKKDRPIGGVERDHAAGGQEDELAALALALDQRRARSAKEDVLYLYTVQAIGTK
jgi:hypothetical protein